MTEPDDPRELPERVVHARGVTAFGHFESYGKVGDEPITTYTRAKVFRDAGKRTDVAVRFSTMIGDRDSSEAARDPRGFAVKFYTEDGNWDLVGYNLGVYFIRDAVKFPDVIHALKPDPVDFEQKPGRIFDFMSRTPESMHMLVNLFSPRGIPADYRHMQGFGVNTYRWVDEAGETVLVKYHWIPRQGVASMTAQDAANVQAAGLGHATRDLYAAITAGDFPQWELRVQIMSDDEHPELDFDPLDDTKVWPENDFPPRPVGRMVLDRMPDNLFAASEQIAFGAGVLVDGLDLAEDEMLTRRRIPRTNDYRQAGQRYLLMQAWERDDLVDNLVHLLKQAERAVQERMVWHFLLVENDLGLRVGEGLGIAPDDVRHLEPLTGQDLTRDDRHRLAHLGKNPPRDVEGLTMTHCVPNERVCVTR